MKRALALCLAGACAAPLEAVDGPSCPDYRYESQFAYAVVPDEHTPSGIALDRGHSGTSPDRIDELVADTEACLAHAFGTPPRLPPDVIVAADCVSDTFELPIARDCLVVKIPDDWQIACEGHQQVLPTHAPDALCRAKGLEPDAKCPCRWRAGIQDGRVLVTTPNLHMLKDPLIRLATGCNNPWAHPLLAHCAMPHDDD